MLDMISNLQRHSNGKGNAAVAAAATTVVVVAAAAAAAAAAAVAVKVSVQDLCDDLKVILLGVVPRVHLTPERVNTFHGNFVVPFVVQGRPLWIHSPLRRPH